MKKSYKKKILKKNRKIQKKEFMEFVHRYILFLFIIQFILVKKNSKKSKKKKFIEFVHSYISIYIYLDYFQFEFIRKN